MSATRQSYTESYPAVPESVAVARARLTQFAAEAGADGERLEAIRLAASEAITNAVLHAYPQAHGDPQAGARAAVQITACRLQEELWILVADEGTGLRSRSGASKGLGLGLALIAQLADDFEIVNRGGGGTELRMRFTLRVAGRAGGSQPRGSVAEALAPA